MDFEQQNGIRKIRFTNLLHSFRDIFWHLMGEQGSFASFQNQS
jgi:hypothetical protein